MSFSNNEVITEVREFPEAGYYGDYIQLYSGETVTIKDGGQLRFGGVYEGYDYMYPLNQVFYVYGTLKAEFEKEAYAIYSACPKFYMTIDNKVELTNAGIYMGAEAGDVGEHGHDEYYYMSPERLCINSGGELTMTGGQLDYESYFDTEYDQVAVCGKLTLDGTDVDAPIRVYVDGDGCLTAKDCIFDQVITLYNYNGGSLSDSLKGSGNTFTSRELMYLEYYSGDFSDVYDFIGETIATSPYISFYAKGEVTVAVPGADEPQVGFCYRGSYSQSEVTIEEGAQILVRDYVDSYGSVEAAFKEQADAIVGIEGESTSLYLYGKTSLSKANIDLTAKGTASGSLYVYSSGELTMSDASITTSGGMYVSSKVKLTDVDVTGGLTIQSGGSAEITGCDIRELTISLRARDLKIVGNDFSNTTIKFTDVEVGGVVNLSGNDWGTTNREVILARLGEYAANVYLGELDGEYIGTQVYTVTNTNNSGDGSLRWALEQASAYTGNYRTEIRFSEKLAGMTISLETPLVISGRQRLVNLSENAVAIEGADIRVSSGAEVYLENMVMESMALAGDASLVGTGNKLTGTGAVVKVSGSNLFTELFEVEVENADASWVLIDCTLNNSLLNLDALGLSYRVTGKHDVTGQVSVEADETLVMEDGAELEHSGSSFTIDGTFVAENTKLTDTFTGKNPANYSYYYLYVNDNGSLHLKNAVVSLSGYYGAYLQLKGNNASLTMEGGELTGTLSMKGTNASAELNGVTINGSIEYSYQSGTCARSLILEDSTVSGSVIFEDGVLNVTGSHLKNGITIYDTTAEVKDSRISGGINVRYGATLTLNGCEVDGYFEEGYVNNISGGGNTFTGEIFAEFYSISETTVDSISHLTSLFSELNTDRLIVQIGSPFETTSDVTLAGIEGIGTLECRSADWTQSDYGYDNGSSLPVNIVNAGYTLTLTDGAVLKLSGGGKNVSINLMWSGEGGSYYDHAIVSAYCGVLSNFAEDPYSVYMSEYGYDYGYFGTYIGAGTSYNGLQVAGTVKADYDETSDAIVADEDYVRLNVGMVNYYDSMGGVVYDNSSLILNNANIRLTGEYNDVYVHSYSEASMTGGEFRATDGWINEGFTTMIGVEVRSDITGRGYGELVLDGTSHSAAVSIEDSTTATITGTTGITRLTIKGGTSSISGNDFSNTTIDLSSYSGKIDLSGNYWGEGATLDSIKAQIVGYNSRKVTLSNWLTEAPERTDRLVVTNTNDSGEGSLRWALAEAAASTEEVKPKVVFNSTLAGETITAASALTVAEGVTVELSGGVTIEAPTLTLNGTLRAEYATATAALSGEGKLLIGSTGELNMVNAEVSPAGGVSIAAGGRFLMDGGSLASDITFVEGATASLSNLTLTHALTDVHLAESLTLKNCVLTMSDGLTLTSLANLKGSGNEIAASTIPASVGAIALTLGTAKRAFTGSTEKLNTLFTDTGTTGAVTLYHLGDAKLADISSIFEGGYISSELIISGDVEIEEALTICLNGDMTVQEGASFVSSQPLTLKCCYDSEILVSENGVFNVSDLQLEAENNRIMLSADGDVQLKNTQINAMAFGAYFEGTSVWDGVTLNMSDNSVSMVSGSWQATNCHLSGMTLYVSSQASLLLKDCTGPTSITVTGSAGDVVMTGNDFSNTEFNLYSMSGGIIDLSGNYWGTTDRDEIIAKIAGYSETKVKLDSWLVGDDSEAFKLNGIEGDNLLSASDTTVTLSFSHSVDVNSITAENLYMQSLSGEKVEFAGYSVEGGNLVLTFEPLSADGRYDIVVGDSIKSVDGQTITMSSLQTVVSVTADVTSEAVTSVRVEDSLAPGYIDIMLSGSIAASTVDKSGFTLTGPDGETLSVSNWNMPTDRILRLYVSGLSTPGEYTLTLPNSLADAAGNKVSTQSVNFSVLSADTAIVPSETSYEGYSNGNVSVNFSVLNEGNLDVTDAQVEIWLTKDGVVAADSVLLDIATIETLAAGGEAELSRTLILGDVPGLEAGEYKLVATVGGGKELFVLSEDNSGSIGNLTVNLPEAVDFVVGFYNLPDSINQEKPLTPGEQATVYVSLKNEGSISSSGKPMTLVVGIIPAGGTVADLVEVARQEIVGYYAGPGATVISPYEFTIPADIAFGGEVKLVAVLTSQDYEHPENLENNIAISDVLPLQQLLSITSSVSFASEGSSSKVVYTITRTGDCSEALTVTLSSEQAARLGLPETVTIAAGQRSARVQAAVVNDSEFTGDVEAVVEVSASGYVSGSTRLTIVEDELPTISVSLVPADVTEGADMVLQGMVSINTVSTQDIVVKLGSNFSGQIKVPATVTIKAGETSASFMATVVNDETAEIDKEVKITAATTGFNSGSATVLVKDDDLPQVELVFSKEIVSESDGYYALTATLVRKGGSSEAITVKLQDVDGIGLILPDAVPMGAGVTSVKFTIGVIDDALANGERTGKVRGTIIIDDCGCDASTSSNGGMFETSLTVQDNDSPALTVSLSKTVLREGGEEKAILTLSTNYVSEQDVVVTLADNELLNLPATITIPAGETSVTCEISAKSDGLTDGTQYTTITAMAEGYISGRGYMQITDMDVPDLVVDSITLEGAAIAGQKVNVSVVLRNQGYAATDKSTPVEIRLSDGTVLGTISAESGLAAGASTTLTAEITLPAVSGQYNLVAEVDKENKLAELDDINNIGVGELISIGSGYTVTAEIEQDIMYSAGQITIRGNLSAEADGISVAGQTIKLYLYRNGQFFKEIQTTTAADGSYEVDYSLSSGLAGKFELKAGVFSDVSDVLDTLHVAGLSLATDSKDLQWLLSCGTAQTGTLVIRNSGSVDLHDVSVATIGLPTNISIVFDKDTMDIAAGQSGTFRYTIIGNELNSGEYYSDVLFSVTSSEGTGINVKGYSYVINPLANLSISAQTTKISVNPDGIRYVELTITNTGEADSGLVKVSLPDVDWLSIYSGGEIANLASGQSAKVVLKIDASDSDVVYNAPFGIPVVVNAENANGIKTNLNVTFVPEETATLTINITDGFSLVMDDKQKIAGARVRLYNAYTQELVASGYADENGQMQFSGLNAGQYYFYVDAENCERYKKNVTLEPGANETLNAYLINTTVEYTFNVVPKEIEDQYEIVQDVTFTTNVPAAVMVFNEPTIQIPDIHYGETIYFSFTVSNYGLVAAESYYLQLPELENLTLTVLNPVERIEAQTSYEFWVQATADEMPEEKGLYIYDLIKCVAGTGIQWWVDCTSNGNWRINTALIQTNQENCDNLGSGPGRPGTGDDDDNNDDIPPKGPVGPVKPREEEKPKPIGPGEPVVVTKGTCTPCKAAIVNLIADVMGWNQITIGDVFSFVWGKFGFMKELPKLFNFEKYLPAADSLFKKIKNVNKLVNGCLANKARLLQVVSVSKLCISEQLDDSPAKEWLLEVCSLAEEAIEQCDQFIRNIGAGVNPLFREVLSALSEAIDKVEGLDVGDAALYVADLGEACVEYMQHLEGLLAEKDGNKSGDSEGVVALRITEAGRAELNALAFSQFVGEDVLNSFYDRWNRTLDYADRGISSTEDVPEGESTDFFSQEYIESATKDINDFSDLISTSGADLAENLIDSMNQSMLDYANNEGGDVCASVKIRFTQSAVMTREAFEGIMTFSNGSSFGDLKDVSFRVYVHDMNGVDVSEHFRITYHSIEGIESFVPGEDGLYGGVLPSGESGEVYIQYIPDRTLAQEGSQDYRFGAELMYTDPGTGSTREVIMTPVVLTVNPSPSLEMHYFLSEDVYSDDPHTDEVEAALNAEIGFIVNNRGNGVAKNFTVSDLRHEFTENEKGLALELTMMGSSLNGGEIQQSGMSLNFGNLEAGSTNTAVWYFQTNMHGYFSDYSASYTRVDSMGDVAFMTNGTDVSLIESVTTHMLTKSVNADGDERIDFLVNDKDDFNDMADGLYFGDGSYADVNGVVNIHSTIGTLGMGNYTITLTMYAAEGWNYFRVNDPGEGNWRIESISVGGVELDSSLLWQTDRIFAGDGSATYVDRLHWVAEFEQSGYVDFTVTYSSVDEKAPGVEAITGVEDKSTVTEAMNSLTVTFDEEVNTSTFSLNNISLKLQNEYVDLTGLTWEWADDGKSLTFTNLSKYTQNEGLYVLKVLNGEVEDVYGNAGEGSGRQLMWTYATTKVALEMLEGYTDRKLNKRVDTLEVTFTDAVAVFGTEALSIVHTALDGTETSVTDLSGLSITATDSSNTKFIISGLSSIQNSGDGTYSLTVDSEKVQDADGNSGTGSMPADWNLHETPPGVVEHSFIEAEQIVQEIDTITLQFSHEVGSVDLSKLMLTCNGEVYTSASLCYEIDAEDRSKVIVSGISKATPAGKAAAVADGEWKMEIDLSGVEDIYGNVGVGTYSSDWVVDTTAPTELEGITLNGRESLMVAATKLTVGATLPESGLKVDIYDKSITATGLGTLLWSGVVEGNTLSQEITLPNGGSRTLTIVTTDAAGNATTNTYNVLVDMVVLTASTDLEDTYKALPESISITFSAASTELPLSALSLTVDGKAISLDGATLTRESDTVWTLSGLDKLEAATGTYILSIDLSRVSKLSSGLQGQGSYTHSFIYDPVSEVRITNCEISSTTEKLTHLSIGFSTDINYADLKEGNLTAAVRLVNQTDSSVVELPISGFSYADNTLSWSGELKLAGGNYAVVVDPALLTAANGAPLVGNNSMADTAIVNYKGDAILLGAGGSSYSAPYAVDWNSDGHIDLLVGEKVGSEGKVRLYLNNGSGSFSSFSYLQSEGGDLSVSASGCQGIVVALQDITGDGIAELVAGLSNGAVQYYVGQEGGSFGEANELFASSVAGSRAYPTFHDWNGDGTMDIILGTGSGSLMVGLGTKDAVSGSLSFATPTAIAGIEVPGRAAPVFADVNGDGSKDLIIGAEDGSLSLYYATENGYRKVDSWSLPGINWERSRVTVGDLNRDGTADLIVGGSTGEVYVVYGAASTGAWSKSFEVASGAAITATDNKVEGKTATLSWVVENAPDGISYVVELADNEAFTGATRHEVSGTALTLSELADGSFFWRVTIKDSEKPAVNGDSFTVDTIAPAAPAELTALVSNGTVSLSWTALTDATGVTYEVRYSSSADFSSAASVSVTEASLNLSGLAIGDWYWQVRAVDGAGNYGEWSTSPEAFIIDEIVAPETTVLTYWADGLVTSDGQVVSGWWDADKTGTGDTQLCWAAASSNMLAWWQTQYGMADFTSATVPGSADDIFGIFSQNWDNVSGREEYGLTWWISGVSSNEAYTEFFNSHYTGSSDVGAYYAPHYDAAATCALVKEISMTGLTATQVATDWAAIYEAGGILSLGVYSTLNNGSLVGGHTITLWGFTTDASGRLSSITITDSDDATDAALTLSLAYNLTRGYYQIAQTGSRLNGFMLGDYTSLGAFTAQDEENNDVTTAEVLTLSAPAEGVTCLDTANWVGAGDTEDYYVFTATGDGSYKIGLNSATLSDSILLSIGVMENDTYKVQRSLLIDPQDAIYSIDRVKLIEGQQCYIRIENAEGSSGTEYALFVKGEVLDRSALITDNNEKDSATELSLVHSSDAATNSWVGAGDAADHYRLEMTEAGNLTLKLSHLDQNVWVRVYQDRGNGRYTRKLNTTAKAIDGLVHTLSLTAGTYVVEIASYDNGAGRYDSSYALELEKEVNGEKRRFVVVDENSPITYNNSVEAATQLELVSSIDASIDSWVGAGDALDYYRLEMTEAGRLNISLSNLENNARLRVYQDNGTGSLTRKLNADVKVASGLDRALSLTAGTYFIEVASYDNGAGRYNSTYSLELEKEEDGETKRFTIATA